MKRFRYCVDPYCAETILYLRAIQGHCGGKHIDPALQDNVLLPSDFAGHIYLVGSSHDLHSTTQSGLIPGGKDGRHRSDARTSFDHSSKHRETCGGGTYDERCRRETDYRIQGLPL